MDDRVDYEELFYKLICSLTLCDHLGDVAESVGRALTLAGHEVIGRYDLDDLGSALGKLGYTTLWGTHLGEEE